MVPARPVALCPLETIPDGQARGFAIPAGDEGTVRLLVARRGGTVHGYRNACPHVGVPLDWTEDRFMAPDGVHLICGTHGALFRVEDGYCVAGPCKGRSLAPLSVTVDAAGMVILRD